MVYAKVVSSHPALLLIHQLTGGEVEGGRCWGGMQGAASISTAVCG